MNIQEMISKMSPEMLSKGLKQMSGMLSPEQLKQMENAIKNTDKGEMNRRLNALNGADLQKELPLRILCTPFHIIVYTKIVYNRVG